MAQVSHLRDGSTVSVWRNGRVVERSRGGLLLADSYCGSYARYRRWVGFMSSFRTAVAAAESARVASSLGYPLSWNHGKPSHATPIIDRDQLLRNYSAIFDAAVVGAIKVADPRALFCRNVSMVMLGSGVVWGDDANRRIAIISINGAG